MPKASTKSKEGKSAVKPIRKAKAMFYKGHKRVRIEFSFNWEDLQRVKSLPRRKAVDSGPGNKFWIAPMTRQVVYKLKKWGYELDQELLDFLESTHKKNSHKKKPKYPELPEELQHTLYPFQKEGVQFFEQRNGKGLLADEQGTGKTIQTLSWLRIRPEKRPVVIICPAAVKLNWKKEARQWMEPEDSQKVQVLSGLTPYRIWGSIIIINYDILSKWTDELKKLKPEVMVTDEAHYYKNNDSQRTKAVKRLGKSIPHVLALTGTPILNKPIEAYNALKLVGRDIIPPFWTYARRYCNAKYSRFGWDMDGASHTEELHNMIDGTVMLRRTKAEVLPELPERLYSFVPLAMSSDSRKKYMKKQKEIKGEVEEENYTAVNVLQRIEKAKQEAVAGKMDHAVRWIKDFLDDNGKLVVFTTHQFTVEILMEEFGEKAVKVDGSVTGKKRERMQHEFRYNSDIRLMVANIQAAGTGINLHQACSTVAFLELPWTPGELKQATDRVHRIGQNEQVNVYYLLANETIEEDIAGLLDRKQRVLDSVLDGQDSSEEDLIKELIDMYKDNKTTLNEEHNGNY